MSEYAVSVEEALRRLAVVPEYDAGTGPGPCVHTFADSAIGLLGAHWYLADVRAFFEEWGVEESGPAAQAMQHGLVARDTDERRTIFFETLPEAWGGGVAAPIDHGAVRATTEPAGSGSDSGPARLPEDPA